MKNYIIPIFIPHYGCPHDCVFCNQRKITGFTTPFTPEQISEEIERHLKLITKPRRIEVAFYGGSFTALGIDIQRALLTPAHVALKKGAIHAIRVSTRPDCISAEIVSFLYSYGVTTIELGVQSMDNNVLIAANRGHTSGHVIKAVNSIRKTPIKLGIQLMPGLPNENLNSLIKTAQQIAGLKPDFVRIYPTIVIANTKLADLYQYNLYKPLTIVQAVRYCAYLRLFFEKNDIKVIRTGLQATDELASKNVVLAGPYHPAFGEMVESHIFKAMVEQCLDQVCFSAGKILISHHPKDTSKIRGLKNTNVKYWVNKYKIDIELVQDGVNTGEVVLEYRNMRYVMNKNMLIYL
ncbi:elongator complex protein 3 [Dendrosporobacter sp. 1207_IL3150]|uniref:elongator complex protein 3 n=1 Tax=Dendrosporobacter sp. 1207_IL3150 TaxID=3084054 RepID=UPI002FD98CE2